MISLISNVFFPELPPFVYPGVGVDTHLYTCMMWSPGALSIPDYVVSAQKYEALVETRAAVMTGLITTAAAVASVAVMVKVGALLKNERCAQLNKDYLQNRVATGFILASAAVLLEAGLPVIATVAGAAMVGLGAVTLIVLAADAYYSKPLITKTIEPRPGKIEG